MIEILLSPAGITILDVTLQAATPSSLPSGATLCLTATTSTQNITVLGVPNVSAATVTVSLATPPTSNNCPAGAVAAAIASVGPGGIPTPISPTATTVCIE